MAGANWLHANITSDNLIKQEAAQCKNVLQCEQHLKKQQDLNPH